MHSFYNTFDLSCTRKFPYSFLNIKYKQISCQVMNVNNKMPSFSSMQLFPLFFRSTGDVCICIADKVPSDGLMTLRLYQSITILRTAPLLISMPHQKEITFCLAQCKLIILKSKKQF